MSDAPEKIWVCIADLERRASDGMSACDVCVERDAFVDSAVQSYIRYDLYEEIKLSVDKVIARNDLLIDEAEDQAKRIKQLQAENERLKEELEAATYDWDKDPEKLVPPLTPKETTNE